MSNGERKTCLIYPVFLDRLVNLFKLKWVVLHQVGKKCLPFFFAQVVKRIDGLIESRLIEHVQMTGTFSFEQVFGKMFVHKSKGSEKSQQGDDGLQENGYFFFFSPGGRSITNTGYQQQNNKPNWPTRVGEKVSDVAPPAVR